MSYGWLDLANKNAECPVKFEFHINNESFFSINISRARHIIILKDHSFFLKFKFNWASCVLSGDPMIAESSTYCLQSLLEYVPFLLSDP